MEGQCTKPAGAEPANAKIKSTESKSKLAMVKTPANKSVTERD